MTTNDDQTYSKVAVVGVASKAFAVNKNLHKSLLSLDDPVFMGHPYGANLEYAFFDSPDFSISLIPVPSKGPEQVEVRTEEEMIYHDSSYEQDNRVRLCSISAALQKKKLDDMIGETGGGRIARSPRSRSCGIERSFDHKDLTVLVPPRKFFAPILRPLALRLST